MTFGEGTTVGLVIVETSWRSWDFEAESKQTAETFEIDRDLSEFLNGNSPLQHNAIKFSNVRVAWIRLV